MFPFTDVPAYNLPVYASQRPLPADHARLGTWLLARLCHDRHFRRLSCTHLQGTTRQDPYRPNSGIRLVWGFSCQGGPQTTFSFFLRFLGPFLLFDRAAGFLPPRPQDAKADARSGGSRTARFFSAARKGLVLDGREHDGML
jgi:hypothetical protein